MLSIRLTIVPLFTRLNDESRIEFTLTGCYHRSVFVRIVNHLRGTLDYVIHVIIMTQQQSIIVQISDLQPDGCGQIERFASTIIEPWI